MEDIFVSKTPSNGFTLIELIVTTVIIAVLASVAFVSYRPATKQGRDGRRNIDLESLRGTLEVYRTDCGTYPTTDLAWGQQLKGANAASPCATSDIYIEKVPQDPLISRYKYVYRFVSANKYYLCSYYEVQASDDPQADTNCGGALCGVGQTVSCKHVVTNP